MASDTWASKSKSIQCKNITIGGGDLEKLRLTPSSLDVKKLKEIEDGNRRKRILHSNPTIVKKEILDKQSHEVKIFM